MASATPQAARPDATLSTWNAELAFRPVVEATADKAGLDFMRHLVKNLAESLGVAYAFVAEFAGAADRVKTIAFWGVDSWRPNIEYRLAGTPCEQVVAGELCLYRDDVQRLFPADSDLVALGARSYLGVPLRGAQGQTLGHLAALDTRPMPSDPRGLAVFQVFANRARVEIERLHAEALLRQAKGELELRLESTQHQLAKTQGDLELAAGELRALLEINQSTTKHLRREDLFGALADCVKPLLPQTSRFGIEVPTGPESLRVHVLALDRPSRSPMIEEFASPGTVCRWAQEQRQWFVSGALEELRERFPTTYAVMQRESMESLCALPLLREERSFGALFFMSTQPGAYREIPVALLERVASAVAVAVDNCFAYEELARLRDRLAVENVYLQEEIQQQHNFDEIVGNSPAVQQMLGLVQTVAATDSTVLVLGETGTGKELIARAIHGRSRRSQHPLVKVNCAAISAGLVESELFGHAKGAFTGAFERRIGRFEVADGGTLFLDEVGELPEGTQAKLLRVLQEREFEPVGSSQTRRVDVRVIAATNRDLAREVEEGRFRADLYFRLNVLPIRVPPLRERDGDVELLVHFFVSRFARELGKRIDGVSREAMQRLVAWHWPGNVRELSNVIERAVVLARGPTLELADGVFSLPVPAAPAVAPPGAGATLAEVERQHLLDVLRRTGWVIEGPRGAAALLGLRPSTLRSRMQKLALGRPDAKEGRT
jgi:formate hydrogenlyase transcriptional activator